MPYTIYLTKSHALRGVITYIIWRNSNNAQHRFILDRAIGNIRCDTHAPSKGRGKLILIFMFASNPFMPLYGANPLLYDAHHIMASKYTGTLNVAAFSGLYNTKASHYCLWGNLPVVSEHIVRESQWHFTNIVTINVNVIHYSIH